MDGFRICGTAAKAGLEANGARHAHPGSGFTVPYEVPGIYTEFCRPLGASVLPFVERWELIATSGRSRALAVGLQSLARIGRKRQKNGTFEQALFGSFERSCGCGLDSLVRLQGTDACSAINLATRRSPGHPRLAMDWAAL
jgi:hypothetical protein